MKAPHFFDANRFAEARKHQEWEKGYQTGWDDALEEFWSQVSGPHPTFGGNTLKTIQYYLNKLDSGDE